MKKTTGRLNFGSVLLKKAPGDRSQAGPVGEEAQTKLCPECWVRKPLTLAYWRRDNHNRDGFTTRCKACTQRMIRNHYRWWTRAHLLERGVVGVKCLLWSLRCGVCPCPSEDDLTQCWRIRKLSPKDDGYPVKLS